MGLLRNSLVLLALTLGGCVAASDVAFIPLREMLYTPPAERTLLVIETTSNLPRRNDRDAIGVILEQADLAASHNVMVGFNGAYIVGYDLHDGDLRERGDQFQPGSARLPYELFSAPGTDYALTTYYRGDGTWVENLCYYQNAIVFRLRPGAINYIPKELQPPLYDGRRIDAANVHPDTTELRRALARFPISNREVVVPEVVAMVRYAPDRLDRVLSANDCSYTDRFEIIARYDTGG